MTHANIPFPSEAPVMVLPGTVLFPNAMLPLRIFEPRYRAMLQWALEHDRVFCVALMKPGITEAETEDQFFHTAGLGHRLRISHTGRRYIEPHAPGSRPRRFTGFSQRVPFRIANFQPLPNVIPNPKKAKALAEKLYAQCAALCLKDPSESAALEEIILYSDHPGATADGVANVLVTDPVQRQRFIEEPNAEIRLRELVRIVRARFPAE